MFVNLKKSQIIMRMTKEQKDFLQKCSDEEDRTITAIINVALCEKYPEYKQITKNKGELNGN